VTFRIENDVLIGEEVPIHKECTIIEFLGEIVRF